MKNPKTKKKTVGFKEGLNSIRKIEERIKTGAATAKDKKQYQELLRLSEDVGKAIRKQTRPIAKAGKALKRETRVARHVQKIVRAMSQTLQEFIRPTKEFSELIERFWIEIYREPGVIVIRACLRGDKEAIDWITKRFNKLYRIYTRLQAQEDPLIQTPERRGSLPYSFQAEINTEVLEKGADKPKIKERYRQLPLNVFPQKAVNAIRKYIRKENLRERPLSLERMGLLREGMEYETLGYPIPGELARKLRELKDHDKNVLPIEGEDHYLIDHLSQLTGVSSRNIREWGKQKLIPRMPRYEEIAEHPYINELGKKISLRVIPATKISFYLSHIRAVRDKSLSERSKPAGYFSTPEVLRHLGIKKAALTWRWQKAKISPKEIKNRYYYSPRDLKRLEKIGRKRKA